MRTGHTHHKVQQNTVLWLTVLEQLAWMFEERFGLIPSESQRFYLDQLVGLRLSLQRRGGGRGGRRNEAGASLQRSPFQHARRLAHTLAHQVNRRVPDERQLNSRFVEYGYYPVRTSAAVEQMAEVLLGRLVFLADHLAGEQPVDPHDRFNDLDRDRPMPIRSVRYVSLLLWEGLMEGVRGELDALNAASQTSERVVEKASLVELQLKIHQYQAWWRRVGYADDPMLRAFLPAINNAPN